DGVPRRLDASERLGERRPGVSAARVAAHPVDAVDELAVARDELAERRERRRRPAVPRLRAACERLGALEGIGELRHALGGEAPSRDEVDALPRHADEHVDVRRHERPVRAPEAAGGEHESERRLDPTSTGAYDPRPPQRMAKVPRLPSIYFEKLLESSSDIVVAVDRHGTIHFYNDGARRTLGYAPDEVLGEHVTRLYPDVAEARKVMAALREGKNAETVFVTKSGQHVPVMIAGSLIKDPEGRELGSIGFAKDIRELRRQDQLSTLGEVAVGLAHEINNPLEVIVNNLNLLEAHVARISSDEDFIVEGERLDSIHDALERIQAIVARLADMAQRAEYSTREYLPGTKMIDLRALRTASRGRDGVPPHDPALRGLRILVVEDDLGVCQSLR